MEKIQIVDRGFTLPSGYKLRLSGEQAKKRAYALEDAGEGIYKTNGKVSFKAGEVIEVESIDELGKGRWELISKPKAKVTIAEEKVEEKKSKKQAAAKKQVKK